ncbi:zinc finger protein 771-like [Trichomycterus rosablanca]|uniref:zinc finger protein 771-like n=1 Tax=Trichomycterus rosablanca TaxID=2290929 RepID=UPI002F352C03
MSVFTNECMMELNKSVHSEVYIEKREDKEQLHWTHEASADVLSTQEFQALPEASTSTWLHQHRRTYQQDTDIVSVVIKSEPDTEDDWNATRTGQEAAEQEDQYGAHNDSASLVIVKVEPDEAELSHGSELRYRYEAESEETYHGGKGRGPSLEMNENNVTFLGDSSQVSPAKELRSCPECGKTFSSSSTFYRHMRIHSGERRYHCTQCEKTFSQASSLKIHQRTHTGEKPFQCHACGKTFTRLDNLQIHQRTHTGEKPYECSYCPKTFTRLDVLQNHLRTHTGWKPYQCSHCGKNFTRLSVFQIHQRTHTGERPYPCVTCGKQFRNASNLRNHLRLHTEERPYRCSLCDKTFVQLGHLTSHHRQHTGEKPYCCAVCGKCYTSSSTLLDHKRKLQHFPTPT